MSKEAGYRKKKAWVPGYSGCEIHTVSKYAGGKLQNKGARRKDTLASTVSREHEIK